MPINTTVSILGEREQGQDVRTANGNTISKFHLIFP